MSLSQDSFETTRNKVPIVKAHIFLQKGKASFALKQYSKALEDFLECFDIQKEQKDIDSSEVFQTLKFIGEAELCIGALKDSLESFQCCETIITNNPTKFKEKDSFEIFFVIAKVLKKLNDLQGCQEYSRRALRLQSQDRGPEMLGALYVNLAFCAMSSGEVKDSIDNYMVAIKQFENEEGKSKWTEISHCFFYVGIAHLKVHLTSLTGRPTRSLHKRFRE